MVGKCAPKDVHILIPETIKYIILNGKMDFTEETKLRILKRGDYPNGTNITGILVRGLQEGQRQKR